MEGTSLGACAPCGGCAIGGVRYIPSPFEKGHVAEREGGDIVPPRAPISYLYNTHPLLQSGCLCVLRALWARAHTPSFSFDGAERAPSRLFAHLSYRLVVRAKRRPIIVPWNNEALAIGGPLDGEEREREGVGGEKERTGSFVSPDHVGKRRRFIPFFLFFFFFYFFFIFILFFFCFLFILVLLVVFFFFRPSIGISMWGCSRINRAWEKSALNEVFEKVLRFTRLVYLDRFYREGGGLEIRWSWLVPVIIIFRYFIN